MALNGSAGCWILEASFALASGVSTTSLSTPAVRRPALRSVTRLTLNSVFARDRNINFCRLRTFSRSPAFDAVKIRCLSRRTSASTRRQSIWRQSKGASSGPFTTTTVGASNLSSGSGAPIIFLSTDSPDHVSALSRRTTRVRIRPVMRDDRPEEAAIPSRFPVAFPLPAFASWPSDARRGIRLSSRSAYRARPRARPDLDGVTAFRTHELRPGWVPSIPRGRRCSSRPEDVPDRRLPLYHGQSFDPAPTSHLRGRALRGINEGSSDSPVRSSPRPQQPGWNGPPLRLPPEASVPRRPRADDARQGRGQANEHGPGTTRSTSHPLILQSVVHSFRATSRRTVHSTSAAPAARRACVGGGAEEPLLARRIRSSKRRRHDAYATPRRRRTRA
jgi:hypothetical protein